MLEIKYTKKFRDKCGRILGYEVQSMDGVQVGQVYSGKLKELMRAGQVRVTNLTLTSDNRLIETKEIQTNITNNQTNIQPKASLKRVILTRKIVRECDNSDSLKFKSNANGLIAKVRMIGLSVQQLTSDIYKLTDKNKNIILATTGQWSLPDDCTELFEDIKINHIDFRNVDTSKVENMSFVFDECQAQSLGLSNFNTSKVENMCGMFHKCQVQSLDLSIFNTNKVINMSGMFYWCCAKSIDSSSFNTSKVEDMAGMFSVCDAKVKAIDPRILKAINDR